jgi:hypothetical protein
MGLFSNIFVKMLSEDNVAGTGGVFGSGPSIGSIFNPPGTISSGDRYAPGDARIPFAFGATKISKKGKKKKKKKKTKILIQRRGM